MVFQNLLTNIPAGPSGGQYFSSWFSPKFSLNFFGTLKSIPLGIQTIIWENMLISFNLIGLLSVSYLLKIILKFLSALINLPKSIPEFLKWFSCAIFHLLKKNKILSVAVTLHTTPCMPLGLWYRCVHFDMFYNVRDARC